MDDVCWRARFLLVGIARASRIAGLAIIGSLLISQPTAMAESLNLENDDLAQLLSPLPAMQIQAGEQAVVGDLQVFDYLDALSNSSPISVRRRQNSDLTQTLFGPDFIASALIAPFDTNAAVDPVFLGSDDIKLDVSEPMKIELTEGHCFYQILLDSGESRQLFDVTITVSSVDGGSVLGTQDFPFPTLGGSLRNRISTIQFDAACSLDGMRVSDVRGYLLPLPGGRDYPVNLMATQQVNAFALDTTPLVVGGAKLLPGERRVVSAFDLAALEKQTGFPARCVKPAFANFRAGVGTHTPVIRVLPRDEVLKVLDITRNQKWVRVETLEGEYGFLHASVTRLCDESLSVAQIPPRPSSVTPRRTASAATTARASTASTRKTTTAPAAPTTRSSSSSSSSRSATTSSSSSSRAATSSSTRSTGTSGANRQTSSSSASRSSTSNSARSSSSSSSSSGSSLAIY